MEQDADDDKDRCDLNRKRQREEDESDDEPANSKLDMGSGIHRRGPAKFDFGSEYRAKVRPIRCHGNHHVMLSLIESKG
jgi:hypothetical protein